MPLNATFFDTVKYQSEDFRARDADFIGNGVVKTSFFPIAYNSPANMSVNIGSTSFESVAWCGYGFRVSDSSTINTLTFTTADPTNPRIDIIQIGVNATTDANNDTTGTPIISVKAGVPAASPIEPDPDPGFVKLYAVNISANQTSITSANVIDRRTLVPLNIDGSQITNFSGVTNAYLQAIMQDVIGSTSVVLSGGVASKDSSVANQLDVTAADIYLGTGQHVNFPASQNGQFVTSAASSTYYLDYNPNGTTSWGTTHSITSGYISICSVVTDSSGNISTVTDLRPTILNLFKGVVIQVTKIIGDGSGLTNLTASQVGAIPASEIGQPNGVASLDGTGKVPSSQLPAMNYIPTSAEGTANGVATLDGAGKVPASQLGNAPAPLNATSATPGLVEVVETPTSGAPVTPTRCASFQETKITGTTAQVVSTYTPQANHNFELNLSFRVVTAATTVTIQVTYTDAGGAESYLWLPSQSIPVGPYALVPFAFNATTGGAITVTVTTGTANQVFTSGALKAV